jgi:predicted NodU family carbamoyl transferase
LIKRLFFTKQETLEQAMKRHLKDLFPNASIELEFVDHQYCHALAAYFSAPFEKCLVFTSDGFGDDFFSRLYLAEGGSLKE